MKIKLFFSIFFLLGILSIPFPYHLFGIQKYASQFIFEYPCIWFAENVFQIQIQNSEITSDSVLMYILIGVLIILAFLLFISIRSIKRFKDSENCVALLSSLVLWYYLALQLFKYGFHKIFKGQFYLPEPNILYTPFGELDKDILFWSTMGVSYEYNIFMGLLEIVPAVLILFKKTRVIGGLVALPVLLNILAIDFSYDISVKLFSIFLLAINLFVLTPHLKPIILFLIGQQQAAIQIPQFIFKFKPVLKSLLVILILLEALFPYISTWNFNDDTSPRPYLHGAYEVVGSQPTPLDSLQIKRLFIHRQGYLIFQSKDDNMEDYQLQINQDNQTLILMDYDLNKIELSYTYSPSDSLLQIPFYQGGQSTTIQLKALDWQSLPALQRQFHWTVEGVE